MSRSIKYPNNTYLSTKGIVHGKKALSERLKNQDTFVLSASYNESIPLYYLLAKLPKSSNSTSDVLRINGFLGSWISSEKVIVDILISNRGGLNVYGTFIGSANAFENTDLQVYEQSNGEQWVYLVRKALYTGGVVLDISGTNVLSLNCNPVSEQENGTRKIVINGNVLTKLNK